MKRFFEITTFIGLTITTLGAMYALADNGPVVLAPIAAFASIVGLRLWWLRRKDRLANLTPPAERRRQWIVARPPLGPTPPGADWRVAYQLGKARPSAYDKMFADLGRAQEEVHKMRAHVARLQSGLDTYEQHNAAQGHTIDRLTHDLEAVREENGKLHAHIGEQDRIIEQLDHDHAQLSGQLADVKERLASYTLAETIADETRAKRDMDRGDV